MSLLTINPIGEYINPTGNEYRGNIDSNALNEYTDIGDYMPILKQMAEQLTAIKSDMLAAGITTTPA